MGYLNNDGLLYLWQKLKVMFAGKVDVVSGKNLSTNDFTNELKQKLDGVEANANHYTLPTAGTELGGVKTISDIQSSDGYTASPIIGGVVYYKDTNTTYGTVTTSTNGLMSAADKTKLDGFGSASEYAKKTDITSAIRYKGSKSTYTELPSTDNEVGDMWNATDTDMNYIWTGSAWDAQSPTVAVESITNGEIDTILAS